MSGGGRLWLAGAQVACVPLPAVPIPDTSGERASSCLVNARTASRCWQSALYLPT
ncbi:hypothetical protein PR003_g3003 [Phytophthora rubi]|uniref:Uncharacterized protein n=1 Tax=Phytophthora rubi TaxID=129364 RepID=A0A6A4G4Z2_9STRA|nr:hypothetical protein PR001_g10765 [Phytophthora rubi]KAE9355120.1 hypothetical protein PR003_g3003 [Phytophthora rubi]